MTEKALHELLKSGCDHMENGNPEAAEKAFSSYCALFPDDPDGKFCCGDALSEQGKIEEAISAYKEV